MSSHIAPKRIVVVGGSFAGMTAAIELKNRLGADASVTVISKVADFLFMPSLIWVPFGLRKREDITFALAPVFEKKNVELVLDDVTVLDLENKAVRTRLAQTLGYDYLVIATGPKLNYAAVPGFGPEYGYVQSIFSWDDAVRALLLMSSRKGLGPSSSAPSRVRAASARATNSCSTWLIS